MAETIRGGMQAGKGRDEAYGDLPIEDQVVLIKLLIQRGYKYETLHFGRDEG